jgi:hypothetical protein
MSGVRGFAGEVVTFTGRLLTLSRKRAAEVVTQLGGVTETDVTPRTTMLVVGADALGAAASGETEGERPDPRARRAADRLNQAGARVHVVDEDVFCERAGLVSPSTLRSQYYAYRAIRGRYGFVRDEHLRYLEKWGLLRSIVRTPGETWYGFADVAVIKQANDELSRGVGVRAVLRALIAERSGQLALDFHPRRDSTPSVVRLPARSPRPASTRTPGPHKVATVDLDAAEEHFAEASRLDTGDQALRPLAMAAYRRALLLAPQLVPAMVNLGNLHYAEDHFPEAQALYFEAALTDPDCLEAHFNLGNLQHDLGRFRDAELCYREALRVDAQFADAHFYLAVTLEKQQKSAEARPHWRRYLELAPAGEWAELAREFTD